MSWHPETCPYPLPCKHTNTHSAGGVLTASQQGRNCLHQHSFLLLTQSLSVCPSAREPRLGFLQCPIYSTQDYPMDTQGHSSSTPFTSLSSSLSIPYPLPTFFFFFCLSPTPSFLPPSSHSLRYSPLPPISTALPLSLNQHRKPSPPPITALLH